MTTAAFNRTAGPIARALNAVKSVHCAPPTYKPVHDVTSTTPCPLCKGTIHYTVRASDGLSTGRCRTSRGCLSWSE
ncbi:hypothetical protein [Polaromonas sp.]|uniref:hypothetical protein n=1 Tax=Polaromonas sp. TaxID=1869339 RepID=UPI0032648A1F